MRTESDAFTQVKEFLGIADIDDSAALDVEEIEMARKRALQMKQARHGVRRRAAPFPSPIANLRFHVIGVRKQIAALPCSRQRIACGTHGGA